jgi:valyl-tRNA synthetase
MPGYEILFFWIARMVLMTGYALDQVPFHTVYLTGIVRDAQGRKFSKSLDNGIDPREVSTKYGMDAGRMALIVGNTPGTDSKISDDKIKGYKNFANKIWNATRFVLENDLSKGPFDISNLGEEDNKALEEFKALVKDITEDMENYRFYLGAEKIYHYFWHTFADILIERAKTSPSTKSILKHLLEEQLKLLHPFMPFITEQIWSEILENDKMLIIEQWPTA